MHKALHRAASLVTTGLLLACGAATAPGAHAATAGCGNNIADYTGAAFSVATFSPDEHLPDALEFNGDGTVARNDGGDAGQFGVLSSSLAVGGSGTVQVRFPGGGYSDDWILTPKCLVGTTVRQLSGFGTFNGRPGNYAVSLSRPSL
ncbi:hypothetical protein WN990_26885 [Kitasatospora purpeofusca]|uniref:hypothetical protein n=1 Tax=Kitasatospora purpeofusca TaxID=67352 RepID=UPI0030F0D490